MSKQPICMANSDSISSRALDHLTPLFSNPSAARRHLVDLPIAHSNESPLGWSWMKVPDWAQWVVPEKHGALFVPNFSEIRNFEEYPWWRAIDFYINLEQETTREQRLGPIHSYSNALGEGAEHAFDFAWVNRIAALLKAWSAQREGKTIEELFGDLPVPKITLTHDVDAVEMTLALKLKQAASRTIAGQLLTAIRILFAKRDDSFLEELLHIEREFGVRSVWLLYVKPDKDATHRRHPLDPEYSLGHHRVVWLISQLNENGHVIGVHSSFESWNKKDVLAVERQTLGKNLEETPRSVRQHWLRFGVTTTWNAQRTAGFTRDFTLGFNNRVGFRASTALPLVVAAGRLTAVPTIVMDSNLFEGKLRKVNLREAIVDEMLDEVEKFGGHVAINWHPHTLGPAYGWLATYKHILSSIRGRRLEVVT